MHEISELRFKMLFLEHHILHSLMKTMGAVLFGPCAADVFRGSDLNPERATWAHPDPQSVLRTLRKAFSLTSYTFTVRVDGTNVYLLLNAEESGMLKPIPKCFHDIVSEDVAALNLLGEEYSHNISLQDVLTHITAQDFPLVAHKLQIGKLPHFPPIKSLKSSTIRLLEDVEIFAMKWTCRSSGQIEYLRRMNLGGDISGVIADKNLPYMTLFIDSSVAAILGKTFSVSWREELHPVSWEVVQAARLKSEDNTIVADFVVGDVPEHPLQTLIMYSRNKLPGIVKYGPR